MKKQFTDQLGRSIEVLHPPQRIVSLVPSQTELLYSLGLCDEVVGQTLFCIHPKEMHQIKPRVGGTKKLKIEQIRNLNPDLIIGNKEENEQTQVELLMNEFPVWMSDIKNLDDALNMITQIGELVGKSTEANAMLTDLKQRFNLLKHGNKPKKVLYLIWKEPWMAAGADTFIHDMLQRCGWENVVSEGRYPELSDKQLQDFSPELILLSSEPFPFKEAHLEELQKLCPAAHVMLVDGEMFSWYGSRLLHSVAYFEALNRSLV